MSRHKIQKADRRVFSLNANCIARRASRRLRLAISHPKVKLLLVTSSNRLLPQTRAIAPAKDLLPVHCTVEYCCRLLQTSVLHPASARSLSRLDSFISQHLRASFFSTRQPASQSRIEAVLSSRVATQHLVHRIGVLLASTCFSRGKSLRGTTALMLSYRISTSLSVASFHV